MLDNSKIINMFLLKHLLQKKKTPVNLTTSSLIS